MRTKQELIQSESDIPIRLWLSLYISNIGIYDNGYDDILQRFKGRQSSRIVLVFNLKASGGRFTLPMSNKLKRTRFGARKAFQLILNHINVIVTRRGRLFHQLAKTINQRKWIRFEGNVRWSCWAVIPGTNEKKEKKNESVASLKRGK